MLKLDFFFLSSAKWDSWGGNPLSTRRASGRYRVLFTWIKLHLDTSGHDPTHDCTYLYVLLRLLKRNFVYDPQQTVLYKSRDGFFPCA